MFMNGPNDIRIRETSSDDIESLRSLLQEWCDGSEMGQISQEEVNSEIVGIETSTKGESDWLYVVAEDETGRLLGIMGMCKSNATIDAVLPSHEEKSAAELFSAFVSQSERGRGIGRLLVQHLESKAELDGYDEIVVASGPRFRETGWPFWQSFYGDPAKVIECTSIWRKSLAK